MALELEIRDERMNAIFAPDAELEAIATGLEFTEGPVWHPTDHYLMFSDILGNTIYRWKADTGLIKWRMNSHMANGNTLDLHGRLITCEHATSRVSRTTFASDGTTDYEVLATHYNGNELNSPNDIVVKRDGMIYFTDPTSGRSEGYGVPRDPELDFAGVFRLNPETGELTLLADDFVKPNGLCFALDESKLYVNDTDQQHVRAFDVLTDGTLANGRVFAELTGDLPGVADGMKFDSAGILYTCGPGGIQVIAGDGTVLGALLMPEKTANFAWGDPDLRTLYITASTGVYRVRMAQPGNPLF